MNINDYGLFQANKDFGDVATDKIKELLAKVESLQSYNGSISEQLKEKEICLNKMDDECKCLKTSLEEKLIVIEELQKTNEELTNQLSNSQSQDIEENHSADGDGLLEEHFNQINDLKQQLKEIEEKLALSKENFG